MHRSTGSRRRRLALLIAAVAAVGLLATACGDDSTPVEVGGEPSSSSTTTTTTAPPADPDSPEARLAAARALWAEEGPDSYRITTRELCFCPETIWTDTIVDGEVISHRPGSDDSLFDPGERTMLSLFDEVADAIDSGYHRLELELDPETGALERYWVDVEENVADEEHGVEVIAVEPVDEEITTPVEIDFDDLTDDYGCGYGFARGSADQTLALVIEADTGAGPDVSASVVLPAEGWSGEVRTGSDLFSNWCDDVIEPDEPVPQIHERWNLVAGTLTVDSPAEAECGGPAVRATLTDAAAAGPAGERFEIGDVDLSNPAWGCFAG